ncbi:MAG: heat-inducible transcriptional repressor HrcA [Thermodesulfovibrionales bacterium]|nr:heat-inducible transcriptional repressor HrcA [Thermodesulfovibrionales bacterium]
MISSEILDERSKKVLCAVVESYIRNPEPVGSRFLTRKYSLGYSSATIRNIMADLEEYGYLTQPHTSAGRVPTDKGYRFYVNCILGLQERERDEELESFLISLTKTLGKITRHHNINTIFSQTTDTISTLTNYISLITSPRPQCTTFKRLDLIRYSSNLVVAILLTNEGLVINKIINIPSSYSQQDLNRIIEYLNSEYIGYRLDKIMEMLHERISAEKSQYSDLINKTIKIYQKALSLITEDIFVSGVYNAINLPDFSDISKIKELYRAIKEKHLIIKLLNDLLESDGVQIYIGSENPIDELKGLSIVASTYKDKKRNMGVIALLGPKRMDYLKAIHMVDTVAKLISKTFD